MENAGQNEQLGITTLVVVFVHIAHKGRVIQPQTEDQALYNELFFYTDGLVLWGVS